MAPAPSLSAFNPIIDDILRQRLDVQRIRQGLRDGWLLLEDLHWRYQRIELKDKIFVPSEQLRAKTNFNAELMQYATLQKGFWNYKAGVCNIIKGWTEQFVDDTLKLRKAMVVASLDRKRRQQQNELTLRFHPGADPNNYHSTGPSPHRLYHPVQNVKRVVKEVQYEHHVDADIRNCFGNLAAERFRAAGLLNTELEAFLLGSLQLEVNHLNKTPKQLLLRAIHGKKNGGKLPRTNNERYNEFCEEIRSNWRQMGVTNVHIDLTKREREIMDRAVAASPKNSIAFLIYDGICFIPGTDEKQLKSEFERATGMEWKFRTLGSAA